MTRSLLRLASESTIEFLTFGIVNYRRFPLIVRLMRRSVRYWMLRQVEDRRRLLAIASIGGAVHGLAVAGSSTDVAGPAARLFAVLGMDAAHLVAVIVVAATAARVT